jgi:hypothetical protein
MLSRTTCTDSFLVTGRFIKVVVRLRRQAKPLILDQPITIPTDELQDNSCLDVHPFIELFGSAVAVCLDLK